MKTAKDQTNGTTEWFAELRDVHVARGAAVVLDGIDLTTKRGGHAVQPRDCESRVNSDDNAFRRKGER